MDWLERVLTDQQEEIFAALLVAALIGLWAVVRRSLRRKKPTEVAQPASTQTVKIEVEQRPAPEVVTSTEGRPVTLGRPNENFTGRAAKIDEVIAALNSGHRASIVGVAGMGGIGKTALAELVGHRLLAEGRFPDGAVKVDLHGFSGAARSPRDALLLLLSAVGQPTGAPQTDDEATAVEMLSDAWVAATTGKDMLVLLDNAGSAEQIAPLMPGQGATALVTSRRNLTLSWRGGGEPRPDVGRRRRCADCNAGA